MRAVRRAVQAGDRQVEILARGLVVVLAGLLVADFFGSREYDKQLWLLLSLCPAVLEISGVALAGRGSVEAGERRPAARPG